MLSENAGAKSVQPTNYFVPEKSLNNAYG